MGAAHSSAAPHTVVYSRKRLPPSPARLIVEAAIDRNTESGHEHLGSLSLTHGFLPLTHPETALPPEFAAWDELAYSLPELLSSGRLRQHIEEMPVLDAHALPARYVLRGVLVVGYAAHMFWNVGGPDEPAKLP